MATSLIARRGLLGVLLGVLALAVVTSIVLFRANRRHERFHATVREQCQNVADILEFTEKWEQPDPVTRLAYGDGLRRGSMGIALRMVPVCIPAEESCIPQLNGYGMGAVGELAHLARILRAGHCVD